MTYEQYCEANNLNKDANSSRTLYAYYVQQSGSDQLDRNCSTLITSK